MSEAKRVEDFQSSTLEAISLAIEDLYSGQKTGPNGSKERDCTFVPRLSTMRVLTPHLASHVAIIRPAGPAPTMRTST